LDSPDLIAFAWLMSFSQPWWLLLTAAAAGPIVLAARARRGGRYVPPSNVALQCLAVVAAAAALAGPLAPIGPRARKPVLVLRDVSASCRGQIDRPIRLPEDQPVEPYDFAAAVAPAGEALDANQTRLAPPLRLAAARRDQLAAVIIRTDGRFTDADWQAAAAALARAGLPVYILPLESPPPDGRIADLSARREGDAKVHICLTVSANALQRRTVSVRRTQPNAAELLVRRLDLLAGQSATLRLTDEAPAEQAVTYRAELAPADAFVENDAAAAVVLPVRLRVGLVGPGAMDAKALAAALNLPVERPSGAPQAAAGWMDYAAVVLVDQTGTRLPLAARAALAEYVRAGGGLVLIGAGPHASPADRDDPLNRAAALLANPYQRTPLRLIVVLDASGSMALATEAAGAPGRRIKFDQAVEAVLSLRRHLTDADALSVITFSDAARLAYDSGAGASDFAALAEALGRVRPAGPTDVGKALELAVAKPAGEGRQGLVVVLSDLRTIRFRPDRMAAAFRKQKLSLAVVAIAPPIATQPGEKTWLEMLAEPLGAPVVRRDHLGGLAKVFAGFLTDARGEAIRRGRFRAAAFRDIFGRPAGALPEVQAYLLCAPQPKAEVLAQVGDEGHDLLAVRRVGLGRSASLALPLAGGENPAWLRSGELGRVVAALVRGCLRPPGDPRFSGQAQRLGDDLHLAVEAAGPDGPANFLQLTARLASPQGQTDSAQELALSQTAPGLYEAQVAAPSGPLSVAVSRKDGSVVWQTAVVEAAPRELAAVGADWQALRLLAEQTGGRIAPTGELAALGKRLAAERRTPLWPILLAAAAALMLTEWAIARIWHRKG
jgi:hypothetical protein